MTKEERIQKYVARALELGAAGACAFEKENIFFDARARMKCAYGCPQYGKRWSCPGPDDRMTLEEYWLALKQYQWGIMIHTHDMPSAQTISLALEGEAFADGAYFAFSLSDCHLCESCTQPEGKDCRVPKKLRPSLHGVGIDVFRSARSLGFPLEVLKDPKNEQYNCYSIVYIE